MNPVGEDPLNIDIDPDFLIDLVGKLSLSNIADFSETLQSIETDVEALAREEREVAPVAAASTFENPSEERPNSPSSSNHENKEGFLSSIGLFSSPRAKDLVSESPSVRSKSERRNNTDSCKSKNTLLKKKTHKKKTSDVNPFTCDNVESHWPFLSSASFPHKSVKSLHDVFSERGMVYDFQLSDCKLAKQEDAFSDTVSYVESSHGSFTERGTVYDFPLSDGIGFPKSTSQQHNAYTDIDKVSCVEALHDMFSERGTVCDFQSSDLESTAEDNAPCEKVSYPQQLNKHDSESVCSPDSGIGASPSPFSSPNHEDQADLYDVDYYRLCEDDLEKLLAELIEIESSLRHAEIPQSNANVPVLKDAKNAEDHKERILNFLKEPFSNDLKSQLSLFKNEQDKINFTELVMENGLQSIRSTAYKGSKKPSPRSKKHKLGFELKHTTKGDLRHSVVFSKAKHSAERCKILKQIQDAEHIHKKVKLIKRLIVSKKLKRMDDDDRENKKRRIHLTDDSCYNPEEENDLN